MLKCRGATNVLKSLTPYLQWKSQGTRLVHNDVPLRAFHEKTIEGSIYVHWPYCAKRCSYCNFNKYIPKSLDHVDHERMIRALNTEVRTLIHLSGLEKVKSVFFGGGTPSLMRPKDVKSFLNEITLLLDVDSDQFEVTLEANPNDIREKLEPFQECGVNRVSLGVQALVDQDLKQLNRDHSAEEGLQALAQCIQALPNSTSCDLIFGRPLQTLQSWIRELETILQYGLKHISLYQLTVERGTPLWKDINNGVISIPDDDSMADMYDEAIRIMAQAGLERYEISNFAVPGYESIHNSLYWSGGEYLGIGPGAHGRFRIRNHDNKARSVRACDQMAGIVSNVGAQSSRGGELQARIQTLEPEPWMREVEVVSHGTRKIQRVSDEDQRAMVLTTTLRTKSGLTCEVANQIQLALDDIWNQPSCVDLYELGLISRDDLGIKLTSKGLSLADSVLPIILNALEP